MAGVGGSSPLRRTIHKKACSSEQAFFVLELYDEQVPSHQTTTNSSKQFMMIAQPLVNAVNSSDYNKTSDYNLNMMGFWGLGLSNNS